MQAMSSDANEDEEEGADKTQWGSMSSLSLKGNVWTAGALQALTKERKLSEKVVGHIHR